MADRLEYSGSVTPIETLAGNDTNNVADIIHSRVDTALGGNVSRNLSSVTTISYDASLLTTTSKVDINFSVGDYDGLTGNSNANIDFLFIKIISAASTGTPDCTIEIRSVDLIELKGVGDFCILPLKTYDNGTYRLAVQSSGATTVCNIAVLAATWA